MASIRPGVNWDIVIVANFPIACVGNSLAGSTPGSGCGGQVDSARCGLILEPVAIIPCTDWARYELKPSAMLVHNLDVADLTAIAYLRSLPAGRKALVLSAATAVRSSST
ncbi:hypothetical protein [Mycobacterium leprae]|uniref:hypothetical protein n=1 Tax=Mycobacterium leprae TaxID=1769 RepID=UPI0011AE5FC5|nr:hypothetical protein [Mycobacterium leprae]